MDQCVTYVLALYWLNQTSIRRRSLSPLRSAVEEAPQRLAEEGEHLI